MHTIFIFALPAENEVEARNLVSRDSIGRDYIIKAVRERRHRLSGGRKKGFNAGHAGHAMFDGGGDRLKEKGPAAVPTGRVEAAEKDKVDVGDRKDAAVKAPTRTVVLPFGKNAHCGIYPDIADVITRFNRSRTITFPKYNIRATSLLSGSASIRINVEVPKG